jgi:hypothetical protein
MSVSSDEVTANSDEDRCVRDAHAVLVVAPEAPPRRVPSFREESIRLAGNRFSTAFGVECLIDLFPGEIRALRISSVPASLFAFVS